MLSFLLSEMLINQLIQLLQIRDRLRKSGYRTWMDVDNLQGNLPADLGEAVKNSAVILLCMSTPYEKSEFGRWENDC